MNVSEKSEQPTTNGGGIRGGTPMRARARRILERLDSDQRMAGAAAVLIVVSEFLPWYTNDFQIRGRVETVTQTALQAASFVELALLLIAAAVVFLLVWRAEGRRLHLPASDGTLLAIAGAWATLLIFVRMLDRPEATVGELGLRLGLNWGIFVVLAATVTLTIAGLRKRSKPPGQGRPEGRDA